jgi:hypothetical protein
MWLYKARAKGSTVAAGFLAQAEAEATAEQRQQAASLASAMDGAP